MPRKKLKPNRLKCVQDLIDNECGCCYFPCEIMKIIGEYEQIYDHIFERSRSDCDAIIKIYKNGKNVKLNSSDFMNDYYELILLPVPLWKGPTQFTFTIRKCCYFALYSRNSYCLFYQFIDP